MLVVESDSLLEYAIAERVAVRQILCYNTRAWFVFLGNVVILATRVVFGIVAGKLRNACCGRDLNLRGAELGIVEEKGCFGGASRTLAGV